MTNFERIKEMNIRELAVWFGKEVKICGCFAYKQCNEDTGTTCANPILRWLESECDAE